MSGKPARSGPPGNKNAESHGLWGLMVRVKARGLQAIDGRSAVGKALARWRADLIADLGGPEAISTQEAAVIDAATTTKLLLDHADSWLLGGPGRLINARRRALYPIVAQRQSLADALLRHLVSLGLKRRAKPTPSLQDYLRRRYARPGGVQNPDQASAQDAPPGPESELPAPAGSDDGH